MTRNVKIDLPPASFDVLVIDMSHYMDDGSSLLIRGFPTFEVALEYARRRVRDSIEELRQPDASSETLRKLWALYGEDCLVVAPARETYRVSKELDSFIRQPASADERDWAAFERRFGERLERLKS